MSGINKLCECNIWCFSITSTSNKVHYSLCSSQIENVCCIVMCYILQYVIVKQSIVSFVAFKSFLQYVLSFYHFSGKFFFGGEFHHIFYVHLSFFFIFLQPRWCRFFSVTCAFRVTLEDTTEKDNSDRNHCSGNKYG